MSQYTGQNAIEYLIQHLDEDDISTSSHWKKFHKDFKVDEKKDISGIIGFGGNSKEYSGIKKWIYRLLQIPYRWIGKNYVEFPKIDTLASHMTKMQGRGYDLDVLRQSLSLAFLYKNLKISNHQITVAVIGDGFASLSLLLLLSGFAKKVILVNLSKTLLVDLVNFQKFLERENKFSYVLIDETVDIESVNDYDLICIQASKHELLRLFSIDLFINIASMQEMNPETIQDYFSDIREIAKSKDTYFYCCNRIEKSFPDGTIVKFNEYPWMVEDHIYIDELCPWHQKYYSIKPPFYHPYDGPIQHRLIKIYGKN